MGIPRLLTRLKEANIAKSKDLGRLGDQGHTRAIVDGPGFAHYVHYMMEARATANTGLGSGVTYAVSASEAVKFLENLEAYGIRV